MEFKFSDAIIINPREKMKKGELIKKISMQNIKERNRNILDYEIAPYSSGSKFRNKDTLLARITPCLENGKTAQVNILNDDEIAFGSTEFIVFRARTGITIPDYVYFLSISECIRQQAIKSMTGTSGRQRVQNSIFDEIIIEVPSIEEQEKIVGILNSLDLKIEINNKIISNLESQAQATFKSWFVDFEPFQDGNFVESELGMIPEGWEVKELKNVSKRINGFSYTSKDIVDESNINMITIKNFDRNGGLQNDSIKPISKNSRIKKDHYLKTNDILMACTDLTQKADIIGGVILYFENEKFDSEIFSMDLIKLVPFEKDDTFFFYYYLKNPIFKLFAENASSGTTVLHLSKKAVDNFKIVYPAKKHIDRFNDYVFPIIKKQRNLLTQNTKLAELRDALLPKLMAGEIDVSNIKIEGEEVKNE